MDTILRTLCEAAQIELSDDQTELTEEQRAALTAHLSQRDKQLTDATSQIASLQKQLADTEDPEKAKARSLAEAGFTEEAQLLSEFRADKMVKKLGEFVPKGHRLSPAAEEAAREYALEQNQDNLDVLHKVLLSDAATVDLRELGHGNGNDEGDDTETDSAGLAEHILEESTKIAVEKQIPIGEAMSLYSLEHPEEWNKYQRSMGADMATMEGGK